MDFSHLQSRTMLILQNFRQPGWLKRSIISKKYVHCMVIYMGSYCEVLNSKIEREIEGKRDRESENTVMLVQGLQVQYMKCVLFSSYESHLDCSICSAKGCQKTKLWAYIFLWHSSDPCPCLGGCWLWDMFLLANILYLLNLFFIRPVILSFLLFNLFLGIGSCFCLRTHSRERWSGISKIRKLPRTTLSFCLFTCSDVELY